MKKASRVQTSSDASARSGEPTPLLQETPILGELSQKILQSHSFEGLRLADAALVFSLLYRLQGGPLVWLCRDNREADEVAGNLQFFLHDQDQPEEVLLIPGVEADPYRGLSPHPEISARRAVGLWKLARGFNGPVVTTMASIVARTVTPSSFLNQCIHLEIGAFLPRDHLIQILRSIGYVREDPVSETGEFSFRGGIVDIFSPSLNNPVRVEFFGDEIDSIREFDPSTQRSVRLISSAEIVPMREMVVTDREIARWHDRAPEYWNEVRFAEALEEKLQFTGSGELFNGFEYLFPLVLDRGSSLFDYLETAESIRVVLPEPSEFGRALDDFHQRLKENFEDSQLEGSLALPPSDLFFPASELLDQIARLDLYRYEKLAEDGSQAEYFDFRPERKYHGRLQDLLSDLSSWTQKGETVIFAMPTIGMAERIVDMLGEYDTQAHLSPTFASALQRPLAVTTGRISHGFHSPSLNLHLLTQEDVFEERQLKPAVRKPPAREVAGKFLSDFRDLKQGDFVVHIEHGVGMFRGLKRIGVDDDVREFVEISYQNEAKLYVPVDRLDVIQKHSASGQANPRLDRLGGTSWEKTKSRIKKSIRELAEDLLKLYARREVSRGYAFPADDELMKEFEEAFEYEATPDQREAIKAVKKDMESVSPMDRLICGDVGYGKTEVAMRAAFKAVSSNKQVALLAPTTVLAFQHLKTFEGRFEGFPVKLAMLSRFLNREQQKEVVENASLGLVDVLIGTHRLLSKDVQFKDLGLIIVDEEQRFGVAHKEKLKRLKTQVDVLTLSATPIPRTLNMSMIGIRDLSLIETPPKDRLAIQTVVVRFTRNIIRSGIDLELKRNGQVFFVHNSVETIYSIAKMIQEITSEARVAVAHGQMREAELERVMLDFLNYKYDVLVCTTIIENGLDIPRANTLMVNRADRFGLAQLYQLRGRVGRSSRRAYAYLLIPSEETLSSEARKRLAAIKEFSDLGSGFRLAALDLEIRGAGNLLGAAQHGHISAIGFELYIKLLEQAIRELKGEDIAEEIKTSIELRLDIQIPEHYIADSNLRLWLYKRVSSAQSEKALASLREEIIDRFGNYPRSVSNLFNYAQLRLRAQELKIPSIERRGSKVLLKFREDTPVSPDRVIQLVQSRGDLNFSPPGDLEVRMDSSRPSEIFEGLHRALDEISIPQ